MTISVISDALKRDPATGRIVSTSYATLTAMTINGPVTLPLTDGKFRNTLWRQRCGHSPRPRFVTDRYGVATLTM